MRLKVFCKYTFPFFLILALFEFRFLFEDFAYQKFGSFGFFDLWTIWHVYLLLLLGLAWPFLKSMKKIYLGLLALILLVMLGHEQISPVINSVPYYYLSFYLLPILGVFVLKKSQYLVEKSLKFTCCLGLVFTLIATALILDWQVADFLGRLTFPYVDPLNMSQMTSANWLAFLLASLFCLSLEYDRSSTWKNLGLVIAGLLIIWTQSYGAVIALVFVLLMYVLRRHLLNWKKLLAGFTLLCVVFGPYLMRTPKFQILLGNYHMPNSLERRWQITQVSWELLKQNWQIGIGINNFQKQFALVQAEVLPEVIPEPELPPHPHNLLFFMGLEFGVLGLLFPFYLYYLFFRRRLSLSMQYILIHTLIDMPFLTLEHSLLFWLSLIIA